MTHEEKLIADRAYKAAHREELRIKALAYYARTKDEQRAHRNAGAKARYHASIEVKRAKRREWYAGSSQESKDRRQAQAVARYHADLELARAKQRAAYYRNHEQRLAQAKRYVARHYAEICVKDRARSKRDVIALKDWYVRMLLGLKDCPKELIEVKRELIKLRRLIREQADR